MIDFDDIRQIQMKEKLQKIQLDLYQTWPAGRW